MKLEYYKSDKGIYVAKAMISYLSRRDDMFYKGDNILINGKPPTGTHHTSWLFVPDESELLSLSKKVTGECSNYRWELRENVPALLREALPAVISKEDSHEYYDDGDDYCGYRLGEKCVQYEYSSSYERVSDVTDPYFKDETIEITYLGEIDSSWVSSPKEVRYTVKSANYRDKARTVDIITAVNYSELSRMLTPDLLLHNQPCSLSSELTYKIVRNYVKDNILSKQAVVTSDYDFCFTVKKKIAIKPFIQKTEQKKANGSSYVKPRISQRSIEHKEEQAFAMTHSGSNYKGYTAISGFKGDSLEDLVNNVKTFLDELVDHLNMPLEECSCCAGTGHILPDEFNKNKR